MSLGVGDVVLERLRADPAVVTALRSKFSSHVGWFTAAVSPVLRNLAVLHSKGIGIHVFIPTTAMLSIPYFKNNIQNQRETFSALRIAIETRKDGVCPRKWRGGRNSRGGQACLRHEGIFSFETMLLVSQAGLELVCIGFHSRLLLLSLLSMRFVVLITYL